MILNVVETLVNDLFCSYITTKISYIYVTGPAKIDHVSAKKSPIFSVFAVS